MTNEDREGLERAIKVARNVHDRSDGPADDTAVILGSLIRAVELLAVTQSDSAEYLANATLVERVANAARAACWNDENTSPEALKIQSPRTQTQWVRAAEAMLSELAATPVELPTEDDCIATGDDGGAFSYRRAGVRQALSLCRPILAAKDARIAELEAQDQRTGELLARTHAACIAAEARVSELEQAWDMLKKSLDESDLQRNEGLVKIAELEKRFEKEADWAQSLAQQNAQLQNAIDEQATRVTNREIRIAELEKRLAEATAPSTVDGKTPGQTLQNAMRNGEQSWEVAAQAVLRTHGQAMAKQAAAEALSTLRRQFEFVPKEGDVDSGKWVLRADVLNALDAQCDPPTNAAGATPAHVARDAFLSEFGDVPEAMDVGGAKLEAWGRVALAILNSFGGTSEAMQAAQNEIARLEIHGRFARHLAADALKRVRERINVAPVVAGACRIKNGALSIIDDELAKLDEHNQAVANEINNLAQRTHAPYNTPKP